MEKQYDCLIKGAKVFDGSPLPLFQDIAVADGKIIERGHDLSEEKAAQVINAEGKWLIPGMFDIHTHYDLELELDPTLPESTRHGTTTVVIANCSLGLAFGSQRKDDADPIVDCYARVENIPKSVLRETADKVNWKSPAEYLQHLNELNLGPNVVTLIPHSMLRIEAMGFEASIHRDPTQQELTNMKAWLKEALDIGYAGFSTDGLPFHYLANQPNTEKTIPTQFAKYPELKALTDVVRECEAIWQATPSADKPLNVLKTFLLTSGRLHKKPLKTTVVAAIDVQANRNVVKLLRRLTKMLNSKWLQGNFHLQALGASFKIWAQGAVTPIAEEIPELRRLNATDIEEREKRATILADPEYIKAFKKMWLKGKEGLGIDRVKKLWRLEDYAFNREIKDMVIDVCPLKEWQGLTFDEVFKRILHYKSGVESHLMSAEKELIEKDFFWIADEADFMLQMLRTFDMDLNWYTMTANRDKKLVRELIMDPMLMPGFNDSGAHLTNMAFYDGNLRSLQMAAQGGDGDVAYMVKRLTKDAAELFGVEGGTLECGTQADIVLIDPDQLVNYDAEANTKRIYRKEIKHEQLVNRSDGVVEMVMIAGNIVWRNDRFSPDFGTEKCGNVLLSKQAKSPLFFVQDEHKTKDVTQLETFTDESE